MKAQVKSIRIPENTRLICISDIHGEMDLFKKLLDKVGFCDDDVLVLLGDLYNKGSQSHSCLKFIIEMDARPNVHVLRGNGDRGTEDYFTTTERAWMEALPHIIDGGEYVFAHAGLKPGSLHEQDVGFVTAAASFLDNAPAFEKWLVVGHWVVNSYCREIPCLNPIINEAKRIISIDGGCWWQNGGQLNAFMMQNGKFYQDFVDKFQMVKVKTATEGKRGTLSFTWHDRFAKIVKPGPELSLVHHTKSGKEILAANSAIYQDHDGNTCADATDHWLSVNPGDIVSVVERFSDRVFAKSSGECGWIWLDIIEI